MSIKESFKTRTALAATKVCCIKMIDKSWNVDKGSYACPSSSR